jgi:hypothetical protein
MKKRKQQTLYIKQAPKSVEIPSFRELDYKSYFLPMIVVYRNTSEFPGKVVARLFDLNSPTPYIVLGQSLETIRETIPGHFTNIGRKKQDDPVIKEVWV